MSDKEKSSGKKLHRLKTGAFERKASLATAGVKGGGRLLATRLGSVFLDDEKKQQKRSEVLSEEAQKFVDTLSELKGSMVKMGQMMALYGQSFLPKELLLALRQLESESTPLSWPVIEKQLIQQLGLEKYNQLEIEKEPLGSASLSQVHKAQVINTGETLALKVLYPGIKDSVATDMKDLSRIMRFSGLVKVNEQFEEWLLEIENLLQQEVDYKWEASAVERFQQRLGNDANYAVPAIFQEFSAEDVLAYSFEAGATVTRLADVDQDIRNQWGKALLQLFMREVFEWGEIQTDPNFGNYLFRLNNNKAQLVLLDFGATRRCDEQFLKGLKACIMGAWQDDFEKVRQGAIDLKILPETKSEKVFRAFFELCKGLLEPGRAELYQDEVWVDGHGRYLWRIAELPKRMAKQLTYSDCAKDLAVPPKEFLFVSRKLLGVYNLLAALDAKFDAKELFKKYLEVKTFLDD